MSKLKLDLKKRPTGEWNDIRLELKGEVVTIKILATSPFVLRTLIEASPEVRIHKT